MILSNVDVRNNELLPSQAGILDGFRVLYRFDYYYRIAENIPGKVYNQYIESDKKFTISADFKISDEVLYNCLYNHRNDEIYCLCNTALARLCECYYINDYTIMISYMFDILDMLDPDVTEGNQLKSHVLPFVCNNKAEYHQTCSKLNKIRNLYRNPLVHYGENIYNLISTEEEIYILFDDIKHIIVSFCKSVFLSDVKTFSELEVEREKRKAILHL